ncbi:hypothetical protein IKP85_05650 [bacterium]|nr:hypothetical protein [bacterium]
MIYSIENQREIPVSISKKVLYIDDELEFITNYNVCDGLNGKEIGYVNLKDTQNGVKVLYIRNHEQKLYKHFGQLADQIELEHCLNRGLDTPNIQSVAARNTHILHFLRGKRFINEGVNIYLDYLIKNMRKGEQILTDFFGYQKMYMPINMINEIKEKIKINPLLKK